MAPRPTKVGRKSVVAYDPGLALEIIERVAEGETLGTILSTDDMPSRVTFSQWRMLYPALDSAYQTARKISAEALEEEALGEARFLSGPADYTGTKVSGLKAAMEQLRWSAQRRDPASYGQDTLKQALVVPIQINTSLDLGAQGTSGGTADIYSFSVDIDTGEGEAYREAPEYEPLEDKVLNARSSLVGTDMLGKKPEGRPKGSKKGPRKDERRTRQVANRRINAGIVTLDQLNPLLGDILPGAGQKDDKK